VKGGENKIMRGVQSVKSPYYKRRDRRLNSRSGVAIGGPGIELGGSSSEKPHSLKKEKKSIRKKRQLASENKLKMGKRLKTRGGEKIYRDFCYLYLKRTTCTAERGKRPNRRKHCHKLSAGNGKGKSEWGAQV